MTVVPLTKPAVDLSGRPASQQADGMNWIGWAAGGSLVAAGLLLLTGQRRAGMVAAASGTALALIDQKETLAVWWEALPATIDQTQKVLGKVQDTVNEIAVKREALRRALGK